MKNKDKEEFKTVKYNVYYRAVTDGGEIRFESISLDEVKEYINTAYGRSGILYKIEEVKRG